ncbi:MAG: O-antigen ligase family protein [Candidatus Margulisbacteria bacterium]|nr:O-antigen ligase family protein [Candidatus Margulisiibacteriota bacterium]
MPLEFLMIFIIICVAGVGFLLVRPRYPYILFSIFAPFSYYYAYLSLNAYGTGTVVEKSLKDLFILAVYALWLLYVFVSKRVKFPVLPSTYLIFMFVWIVVLQALRAFTISNFAAVMVVRNMIEFVPLVILVPTIVRDRNDLRFLLKLSLACFAVVFLLAYYEAFYLFNAHYLGIERLHSTLFNPNNLGVYLTMFSLLLISLYLRKQYFFNRMLTAALILASLIPLLLTLSRSALIAFLVGTFMLFKINGRLKQLFVVVPLLVIVLSIFIGILAQNMMLSNISDRFIFLPGSDKMTHATGGRFAIFKNSYDLVVERPGLLFVGTAFQSFNRNDRYNFASIVSEKSWRGVGGMSMDNYYFYLLLGGGITVLFFYCAILWILFKEAMHISMTSSDTFLQAISSGIAVIFVVYAIIGIFGDVLAAFPANFYFWSFIGLLIAIKKMESEDRVDIEKKLS